MRAGYVQLKNLYFIMTNKHMPLFKWVILLSCLLTLALNASSICFYNYFGFNTHILLSLALFYVFKVFVKPDNLNDLQPFFDKRIYTILNESRFKDFPVVTLKIDEQSLEHHIKFIAVIRKSTWLFQK
jgi:hypothetical protein